MDTCAGVENYEIKVIEAFQCLLKASRRAMLRLAIRKTGSASHYLKSIGPIGQNLADELVAGQNVG